MRSLTSIVQEYRSVDAERRLNLFLDCPPLREEFMKIEQEEVVLNKIKIPRAGVLKRVMQNLVSWFPTSPQEKRKRGC